MRIKQPDTDEESRWGSHDGFDIRYLQSDSEGPLWVEAILGLSEAKERMALLVLASPGEYFIHSQEEGVIARNFWKK